MKKLFTIDDFLVAGISALGYGFGYTIAEHAGWPEILCLAACFGLGLALEEIMDRIIFTKAVQKKKKNRVYAYAIIILVILAALFFAMRWMGVSLLEYVEDELIDAIRFPILGLVLNMLIRAYRVRKIRKIYGDGKEGFVFDLSREDIEETNRQNQAVDGGYDADCAVKTGNGIFVGEKTNKTLCYMGIPYAKPPVGGRRWKAPESPDASDRVFEAKNFGASAIQVGHKGSITRNHRQSEDCLTLNIWVGESEDKSEDKSKGKSKGKSKDRNLKPVLVLFHQGDFTSGGSVDPLMYGTEFVAEHPDVVFVSFNYRLGIFGFIDFSEVPGGEAYPDALNLGLLDQIMALQWIKENIAAFGGNPDRITVLGFDSGATSICLLAVSEKAKGLFRRAFVFNGYPGQVYDTPENARTLARDLLKETKTSTMQELVQLDTKTLRDAAQKLWRNMCAPTCDGILLPRDVYGAYQEGKAADIRFIIGFPGRGMPVWRSVLGNQNYEELLSVAVADLQQYMDSPAAATDLEKYMDSSKAAIDLEKYAASSKAATDLEKYAAGSAASTNLEKYASGSVADEQKHAARSAADAAMRKYVDSPAADAVVQKHAASSAADAVMQKHAASSAAAADKQKYPASSAADVIREYFKTQAAATNGVEAKSRIVEQWNALGIYCSALQLSKGGNKVHIMLWDQKPIIENLGSGTVDAAATLLGNSDALQMYGSVLDNDVSEILQSFLHKFVQGNALQLYHNEIRNVDALNWKAFPHALIVSDGKIICGKYTSSV